jgi:hypothetical protein
MPHFQIEIIAADGTTLLPLVTADNEDKAKSKYALRRGERFGGRCFTAPIDQNPYNWGPYLIQKPSHKG